MFDCVVLSFDLHNRDHVKALELLISFRFKLPSIRGILPSLIDDHVKHVFEHVKLEGDHVKRRLELPCLRAISQTSLQTSLLRRDQVVIQASRHYLQFFLECLDLHWSQNSPVVGFWVRDS